MKSFLLVFICLFSISVNAQSIKIHNIDASAYPKVKAEFTILDANNQEIRNYNPNDFKIKDSGKNKNVNNTFCDQSKMSSIVLTIDKSGSMAWGLDNQNPQQVGERRIDAIIKAANVFLNSLPGYPNSPKVEIALTAFSSGNLSKIPYFNPHDVLSNFTKDIPKVKTLLKDIIPQGATDYNVAFLGNKNQNIQGVMDLCDNSKYKPIVIFLTDGEHNPPAPFTPVNVGEIVNRAKSSNIPATIYSISIGMNINSDLSTITSQTGGKAYKTADENGIELAFLDILDNIQNSGSLGNCTIEWDASCDGGMLELTYSPLNIKTSLSYNIDDLYKPNLVLTENNFDIIATSINATANHNFTLKALNNDINFTALPIISNPKFVVSLNGVTFPFVLPKNSSKVFNIQYTSSDLNIQKCDITFNTNACTSETLKVTGKVVIPNGVNDSEEKNFVETYPNPVNENLNINLGDAPLANELIQIYNSIGEIVVSTNVNSNLVHINTSKLNEGIYIVRMHLSGKMTKFAIIRK